MSSEHRAWQRKRHATMSRSRHVTVAVTNNGCDRCNQPRPHGARDAQGCPDHRDYTQILVLKSS
jgi:hypothetical protein